MKRALFIGVLFCCFNLVSWGGGVSSTLLLSEDRDNDWPPLEQAEVLYVRLVRLHRMMEFDLVVPAVGLPHDARAAQLMVLRMVHALRHYNARGDLDNPAIPEELRGLAEDTAIRIRLHEAVRGDLEGQEPIFEYAEPVGLDVLTNLDRHIETLAHWPQEQRAPYLHAAVNQTLYENEDFLDALARLRSIFARVRAFFEREIVTHDDPRRDFDEMVLRGMYRDETSIMAFGGFSTS